MIEGNENNDLENLEELDDITAVDLALKLRGNISCTNPVTIN